MWLEKFGLICQGPTIMSLTLVERFQSSVTLALSHTLKEARVPG